ncbi:MAG TPA: PaaI family thioesterase [Tepidiformaceae bacterium]|nr:PaaI family thioesterase [Tepidiformaceae bacterium]
MTQPFTAPFNGARIPIAETLQAEIIEHGEGRAVLRYPFLADYTNPMGQLQGGMYGVMMDSAMAIAAGGIATATMQINIFRPVSKGWLTVTGEVVKRGKRIVYAEAEVRDQDGNLVARGNQNGLPREIS